MLLLLLYFLSNKCCLGKISFKGIKQITFPNFKWICTCICVHIQWIEPYYKGYPVVFVVLIVIIIIASNYDTWNKSI